MIHHEYLARARERDVVRFAAQRRRARAAREAARNCRALLLGFIPVKVPCQ